MNVTQTRTQHLLLIQSVRRRPDRKVEIRFSILQAGVWQSARLGCRVWFPPYSNGNLMTPALNDPAHSKDPLMVPFPGAVFTWVWDAPMDGYGSGTLSGLRFELAYVDIYCCEEEPDPSPAPVPPTPPPPIPPIPPLPPLPPPPPPGVPVSPPILPGGAVPPGVREPAGNQEPSFEPPTVVPPGVVSPSTPFARDPGLPSDGPQTPLWPIMDAALALQTRGGVPLLATPETDPLFFGYTLQTHVRPTSPPPSGGTAPQDAPFGVPQPPQQGGFFGTRHTSQDFSLGSTTAAPTYPLAPQLQGLFGVQSTILQVTAFMPVAALPATQRSILYYSIANPNAAAMQGIQTVVIAMGGDGQVRLIQPAQLVQATTLSGLSLPPGTIPPGPSVGTAVCINWDQMPVGPALFLVALMTQAGTPFATGRATGVAYPMGSVVPTPAQAVEYLGPGLKQITGFPSNMQPTYEGSVNAVGNEDTYVFVPTQSTVSIVVQITEDARASGFEPVLEIYDCDDMDNPVATSDTRFQIGGVDVEPEYHAVGWQGTLSVGQHHAIVIRNRTAHYSRRWQFRIFHMETVPGTGGTLEVDDDGNLTGEISCAYGRQSIQLFNDRTGEGVFVKTNERGVTDDIQRDTRAGTPNRRLPVAIGDKIDVIRPGPGVLYRRSQDLIGQGTVS